MNSERICKQLNDAYKISLLVCSDNDLSNFELLRSVLVPHVGTAVAVLQSYAASEEAIDAANKLIDRFNSLSDMYKNR